MTVDVSKLTDTYLPLSHQLWVLEDSEQSLTLADIQRTEAEQSFQKASSDETALSYGYTDSAFWLRFQLHNPTEIPIETKLEIAYASLSQVSLYQPVADGRYESIDTGSNLPFSTRSYPNRFFVFPVTLAPQSEQVLYLRIHSTSSVLIPLRLWPKLAYEFHHRNDYFLQAWYFGIASAMVIFNLLLFFALRDRIYFLYAIFVSLIAFALATDYGLTKEFFWPQDASLWSDIANFVGYSSAAVAMLLFMRQMIQTYKFVPRLDTLVLATAGMHLLALLGVVVSLKTFALATASLYVLTVALLLGVALYCSFVKRLRSARFFLVASSAFLIGCAVGGLSFLGVIPGNFFSENAMQLGSALEMLLLAFALADRVSELQREKKIAAIAFEAQEGIIITDDEEKIIRVNRAFSEITGFKAQDVIDKSPRIFSSSRNTASFYRRIAQSIQSSGIWQGEIWSRRADGEEFPALLTITEVRDNKGKTRNYVGTLIDITARKEAEAEINNLAYYDPLTQLPNRRMLMDRLKMALSASARHHKYGALLFIDLDDFKTINDTLGHDSGDMLLCQVASRLSANVRELDTVARLGGDEFVVLLEDLCPDVEEAATEAERVSEKILMSLGVPYQLKDYTHVCRASIGVTLFCGLQLTVDELLKRTDLAMYDAKRFGGNNVRFFDPDMQKIVLARFAIEAALRDALQKNQFTLYYQMQVGEEGQISGVEALIRWFHPERGMIPPNDFIAIAESSKLIVPIGKWVLNAACQQLVQWSKHTNFAHFSIAVNVSSVQFKLPNFVEELFDILDTSGADPRLLKLELTESLVVEDVEDVITKMNALKARGVSFSLDDFGTGYSSLAYIKRMPFDQLKIDRSFVKEILVNPNDATIARSIIGLAENLGLEVIAEGVENEAQYAFLMKSGCRAFQGYHFSRPEAGSEFERRVRAG